MLSFLHFLLYLSDLWLSSLQNLDEWDFSDSEHSELDDSEIQSLSFKQGGKQHGVGRGAILYIVKSTFWLSRTVLNLKSTTNNPITLQIINGGSQTGINASITIEKIS